MPFRLVEFGSLDKSQSSEFALLLGWATLLHEFASWSGASGRGIRYGIPVLVTIGAAKEHAGKATGDKKMERKGKTDQTKSNLKQAGEKTKDAFDK
jgi:hypothetical protein